MEYYPHTYENYYDLVLNFVGKNRTLIKENIHFIGCLIYSIIDIIDMSEIEKGIYINLYQNLVIKRLQEKEIKQLVSIK